MEWFDQPFGELTRDDLFKILKVRAAVFNDEQKSSWPDPDDNDPRAHHVWAVANGQLVAYARYFEIDGNATLGRVLVVPQFRHQGLARDLMDHVLAGIKQHYGRLPIVIHAQLYVRALYDQYGFRSVGKVFLEAQRQHIKMVHQPLLTGK